ncbi:TonB-dependent receptor [Flavivirga aquimarina]|uniref:TonB-dependent receptor n=1 Tax=Flavivirga aquimarina TaxID=2027862 RepID=A0ABT8W9R4_9FLAO|nr:TonB-dependent receptor [Flavivirga aquimarina]MDO5969854.1 TonB-dependent receptor [Flavivirga aquimarina]
MKLTTFLIIVSLFQIQANNVNSQETKVTINMTNASIEDIINKIESLTKFKFFINTQEINLNSVVTINERKKRISTILDQLFSETQISYEIFKKQIILKKKKVNETKILFNSNTSDKQETKVTGIVYDDFGTPLPGATIVIVGGKGGAISDFDGRFSVNLTSGDQIKVSYIGLKTKTITYTGQKEFVINMESDISQLEDVTIVAFSKQKKESVIGSITTIKPASLKVPSSNLTTSFAGRIPGMIAYQRSGEPGQNTAEFYIRGITTFGYKKDPLILIDNNEVTTEELSRIHPDDVASFSIMKDATATSLYGSRGANGVILVTTKEGTVGKSKMSIRYEQASSSPTNMVELADPITYMNLHNEAVRTRNPLGIIPYSPEKIANTIAGANPNVYPANDWHDMLFKKNAITRRLNMNISGGGKVARYYVAGSYSVDNGILKVDKKNNFNNNIKLNRYMLRSNVNINITETTEVVIRLQGAFDDYSGPIDGGSEIFRKVMRTNPVLFPATFEPDFARVQAQHILFGNADTGGFNNPYADMTKGYRESTTSQISAQFELKQDLSFITEGLSVRGLFNTNRYSNFDVSRFYNPFFYKVLSYDKKEDTYILEALNENSGTEYLGYNEGGKDINSTIYFESAVNWNKTYNEKHAVSALLVSNMRSQVVANAGDLQKSLPYRNLGYAGRATYAYDSRYFAELNFGYNGSERFAKKERFGFFPSAGLGWILSNESFWNGKIKDIFSKVKFRATYGLVGNDAIGSEEDRFFYLSNVNLNDGNNSAAFGTYGQWGNAYYRPGVSISRYPNENITWEKSKKINIGLELELWKELSIDADIFSEYRSNILMDRAAIPSTMGLQAAIRANVGEASSKGLDISFNYNHSFNKDLWITAMGNITYAASKFEKYEEPLYENEPWKSRIGNSLTENYGYVAERLFVDEEEVRNSPVQFGDYMAGDIKYKDINNDGKISELDIVPIGFPSSPEIVYGFGFSGGWKKFDLSGFFQGVGRTSVFIDADTTSPFISQQNALLKAYADDHWSEDNRNVYALWPRLSETSIENNLVRSTWFMRNAAFMRLKSVEIGYTLPEKLLSKAKLTKCRFYASGINLLTFSRFKLWDPEMGGNGLAYPIQKVINFGVQMSF